jgi:hypothetical protein
MFCIDKAEITEYRSNCNQIIPDAVRRATNGFGPNTVFAHSLTSKRNEDRVSLKNLTQNNIFDRPETVLEKIPTFKTVKK